MTKRHSTDAGTGAAAGMDGQLPDALRAAWHRFLDEVEPLRPALHGFCQRLTGHLWDAEDLAQDTLLQGFGRLAQLDQPVGNTRAYLLRIATHLWIDRLRRLETERRRQTELEGEAAPAAAPGPEADKVLEEAGEALLAYLAPRERAALALKDGFDLSLAEVAQILGTSTGAVKAALHRGRARLTDGSREGGGRRAGKPSPELVDRFVTLFRAGDAAGLAALLQDNASIELIGSSYQDRPGHDWFSGLVHGHPEWPAAWQFQRQRLERGTLLGEAVLLVFRTRRDREKLEQVVRLEVEDGRITRLRDYAFCPETIRSAGRLLGLPVRTGPYRYPTPAPGARWPGEGASP